MRVKAYNIVWATDFHDTDLLGLPQEAAVIIDENDPDDEEVANALFDIYGWPVDHFDFEEWDS